MPPVNVWEPLFDVEGTLDRLGLVAGVHSRVVEFGCGYGTFSIPVARRVHQLMTFDIDEGMVRQTLARASDEGLTNISATTRDVIAKGYNIEPGSCDAVLLMNVLHHKDPVHMLHEAAKLLTPGVGRIYATHWQHNPSTPRGPPMEIRPKPKQLETWAKQTALLFAEFGPVACPPWHYGWTFGRTFALPARVQHADVAKYCSE